MQLQSFDKKINKTLIAVLVILTTPLAGFAIDIYVPSLPAISKYFNATISLTQLTVSSYLIGFASILLFIGSISDAIGRKKISVIGFLIFIGASFLIAQTSSIHMLILYRFTQGVAMGCLLTGARSTIADLFTGNEFRKVNGYFMLVWAIGPIIAPAIGGYLQSFFNWQASFYFLIIYGILIFIPYVILVPETIAQKKSFKLNHILISYKTILLDPSYLAGAISCGCLYSIIILFNLIAPFLIQNEFNYSVIEFGYIALLMGFAWFLGNLINSIFIHVSYKYKIKIALWVMSITMFSSLILNLFFFNLLILVVPTFILLLCGGLIFVNYSSSNILLFPKMSGSAMALNGCILLLIPAFFGSWLGDMLKFGDSALPLNLGFMLFIGITIIAYNIYAKIAAKSTL